MIYFIQSLGTKFLLKLYAVRIVLECQLLKLSTTVLWERSIDSSLYE